MRVLAFFMAGGFISGRGFCAYRAFSCEKAHTQKPLAMLGKYLLNKITIHHGGTGRVIND